MAVFSRYARVIENDGSQMTVRSALARINEILDQVLNEQEGEFDSATRFAIAWYRQHGYMQGNFGVADSLARARNTSVESIVREGIITSAASKVKLLTPAELPVDYDAVSDDLIGAWEVLHHLIARTQHDGIQAAGGFLAEVASRPDGVVTHDQIKDLAYLLFHIAEDNRRTQDALAFNSAATSWDEIVRASREQPTAPAGAQLGIDFEDGI